VNAKIRPSSLAHRCTRVFGAAGLATAVVFATGTAVGEAPVTLNDFARELVVPVSSLKAHDLSVPETIYKTLSRFDRGDVCVFDEAGIRVPFAFIPEPPEPQIRHEDAEIFRIPTEGDAREGSGIQVERTSTGTLIVRQTSDRVEGSKRVEILVDLGAPRSKKRLEIEWEVPRGEKLWEVGFSTSEDLLVFRSRGRQVLASIGIEHLRTTLDAGPGERYLRITTAGGFPEGVKVRRAVLVEETRVSPAAAHVRVRGVVGKAPGHYRFQLEGAFPWTTASLTLRAPNARVEGLLLASKDGSRDWSVLTEGFFGGEHESARVAVPPETKALEARFLDKGSMATADPELDLEYARLMLRFLPRSMSPHRIAFGSRRASCEGMASLDNEKEAVRIAAAGTYRELRGEAALKPLAPSGPGLRAWVLWGTLVTAVLALALLAVRLISDLKKDR
jgi:hypothetical protein